VLQVSGVETLANHSSTSAPLSLTLTADWLQQPAASDITHFSSSLATMEVKDVSVYLRRSDGVTRIARLRYSNINEFNAAEKQN